MGGKYLHGFVQAVGKIRGLVLYTANCKAKREQEKLKKSQRIYIVSILDCDTLQSKILLQVISQTVSTYCIKGIFHISWHLLLDNLFDVLVGASDELLEHWTVRGESSYHQIDLFDFFTQILINTHVQLWLTHHFDLSVLTFTFPEMGEASGAQNAHELHLHVVGVCIACICKFLLRSGGRTGTKHSNTLLHFIV